MIARKNHVDLIDRSTRIGPLQRRHQDSATLRTVTFAILTCIAATTLSPSTAADPLSFHYDDGQPETGTSLRKHQVSLGDGTDDVTIYAHFGALTANPAEVVDSRPRGAQRVAIGYADGDRFVPVVGFGTAKDSHAGMGALSFLLPWFSDGRLDYFGGYLRPKTSHDFKLTISPARKRVSCWTSSSGDDDWFLLAEEAPLGQSQPSALDGQDSWVVNDGAAFVRAREGVGDSQCAAVTGQCYRPVGSFASGKVHVALDVRFKRGGAQFVQLWRGAPYVGDSERVLQFGFDTWADHLYAHGAPGGNQVEGKGGLPSEGQWVTIWAILDYDARLATFGWCDLDRQAFLDGPRLSGYAISPAPVESLLFLGRASDRFDNVHVDLVAVSPTEPPSPRVTVDFESPRYRAETESDVEINAVRVEQAPGAPGIEDVVIRATPSPERDKVRPHPLTKKNRVVTPGKGFQFQRMRSVWRKPGRHVTIARNDPKTAPKNFAWLGFPDVVQTAPETLVCIYTTGGAHGGGGNACVRHSQDLGKTWGEEIVVHAGSVNTPRLQKLRDGSLLALCDVHGPYDVPIYRSHDGGYSWNSVTTLSTKEVGGHPTHAASCPSRVTELPDGSWLLVTSWLPSMSPFACTEGIQLDIFRSTDEGKTWKLHSTIKENPRAICEASIVVMPTGRLWLFAREANRQLPGVKTHSDDMGKTWSPLEEMPFPVVGRTCAELLRDGRVLLTHRAGVGRTGLWAWVGDPEEETRAHMVGVHFNDATTVGLRDGALHIDSDGMRGQFTRYFLRIPDGPESRTDVTAELKVVSNQGSAASLSVPYVGVLRFFPDRVELAHDASVQVQVTPGEFHTYRVVSQGNQLTLHVDGEEVVSTDKADNRTVRTDWSPIVCSPYPFAFGNEPLFVRTFEYTEERMRDTADEWETAYDRQVAAMKGKAAIPPSMMLGMGVSTDRVTPRVTGYSIWKRVEARMEHPKTGTREQSWVAARDGFPDQYQLDHVLEVEASVGGGDQGYSGWTELDDGRIFIVNYTDDTAGACLNTPDWPTGLCWIRGTFVLPTDLPRR